MSDELLEYYQKTRTITENICEHLSLDILECQPIEFTSPPKWHLGHTSWFFEEFILKPYFKNYKPIDEFYRVAFNSYYKSQGEHCPRKERGQILRPTFSEVMEYRRFVDNHIFELLLYSENNDVKNNIILGLHHEQQHQELLLMDIKYILSKCFLNEVYQNKKSFFKSETFAHEYLCMEGGLFEIGANSKNKFYFDNEAPEFKYFQYPYLLATRPISNREYLAFINDGGYSNPLLWKSDGWDYIHSSKDFAPLYWEKKEGVWFEYTLNGYFPLELDAPVCHINYYEADAFAEWSGARLPTEFELELCYKSKYFSGPTYGFYESEKLHPIIKKTTNCFFGLTGNLWEWTNSAYSPYPGYQRPKGAFGEYNQKFMVNQIVLRGGSIVTPQSHFRPTYRNFFYPSQKWAFTGLRLAKDIK